MAYLDTIDLFVKILLICQSGLFFGNDTCRNKIVNCHLLQSFIFPASHSLFQVFRSRVHFWIQTCIILCFMWEKCIFLQAGNVLYLLCCAHFFALYTICHVGISWDCMQKMLQVFQPETSWQVDRWEWLLHGGMTKRASWNFDKRKRIFFLDAADILFTASVCFFLEFGFRLDSCISLNSSWPGEMRLLIRNFFMFIYFW